MEINSYRRKITRLKSRLVDANEEIRQSHRRAEDYLSYLTLANAMVDAARKMIIIFTLKKKISDIGYSSNNTDLDQSISELVSLIDAYDNARGK